MEVVLRDFEKQEEKQDLEEIVVMAERKEIVEMETEVGAWIGNGGREDHVCDGAEGEKRNESEDQKGGGRCEISFHVVFEGVECAEPDSFVVVWVFGPSFHGHLCLE